MKIVKNDLFDYKNRYIYQLEEGFKFSLDSLLLAEFVKITTSVKSILDMCTGNAPIPLVLSTKTKVPIIAFEIQSDIANLATDSIILNNLETRINIINDDVLNIEKIFSGKYFDIITCNPPYFNSLEKVQNKNEYLTIARHEVKITLDNIFMIVSKCLSDNGNFYLVHRPERLDEIILLANKYKLFVKELQFITTGTEKIKIVLIRCQKHAKYGIKVNEIIDVNNLNSYQQLFKEKRK